MTLPLKGSASAGKAGLLQRALPGRSGPPTLPMMGGDKGPGDTSRHMALLQAKLEDEKKARRNLEHLLNRLGGDKGGQGSNVLANIPTPRQPNKPRGDSYDPKAAVALARDGRSDDDVRKKLRAVEDALQKSLEREAGLLKQQQTGCVKCKVRINDLERALAERGRGASQQREQGELNERKRWEEWQKQWQAEREQQEKDMAAQIDQLTQQRDDLLAEQADAEAHFEVKLEKRTKDVRDELEVAKDKMVGMQTNLANVKEELARVRDIEGTWRKVKETLEKERSNAEIARDKFQIENQRLATKLAKMDLEMTELRSSNDSSAALQALEKKCSFYVDKVAKHDDLTAQFKSQLAALQNSVAERETRVSELLKELEDSKNGQRLWKAVEDKMRKQMKELGASENSAKTDAVHAQCELEAVKLSYTKLENALKISESEGVSLKRKCADLDSHIADLLKQQEREETSRESLEEAAASGGDSYNEVLIQELKTMREAFTKQLGERKAESENVRQDHVNELREVRLVLAKKQAVCEKMVSDLTRQVKAVQKQQ